jgi:hypothetical protein
VPNSHPTRSILILSALFAVVLCRGSSAADPVKFFDPKNAPPKKGGAEGLGSWKNCLDQFQAQPRGKFDKAPKRTYSLEDSECFPDTLYTWRTAQGVEDFRKVFQGLRRPYLPRAIYAHANPIATFAYGEENVRIKLKPEVRFAVSTGALIHGNPQNNIDEYCDYVPAYKKGRERTTVIVQYWDAGRGATGVDYVICSPEVIQSWSRGMPRHYDEMAAAYLWLSRIDITATPPLWIPYVWINNRPALFDTDIDGKDWSKNRLQTNLSAIRTVAEKNEGEIQGRGNVPVDAVEHFSTQRRSYWRWAN